MEEITTDDCEILSLAQAAKDANFTPEYMNLLARTGKLQAKKIGRNWLTTRKWLNDYLAKEKGIAVVANGRASSGKENDFDGMAKLYFDLAAGEGEKVGGERDGFLRIRTSIAYFALVVALVLTVGAVLYYLQFRNLGQ